MSWARFVRAHIQAIAAADFFTVEVVSWMGLIRYQVLFLIDIASRAVEIAGITRNADGLWMDQVARNLLDIEEGFLLENRYLLLDRDPLYTTAFRTALERGGVKVLRLPARSPNLNAYAERFVLSIKERVPGPDRAVGRAPPATSGQRIRAHYHRERNHQGLENRLIGAPPPANANGSVVRKEPLGGLLCFYHRAAA